MKDYSNYLQFLAAKYNVLYVGKSSEAIYDETSEYFRSASKVDINAEILDKINTILAKRHVNVIVIDVQENDELAVDFYNAVREYSEEILIMLMFNPKEYKKLFEIVPFVDATVSYPIDRDTFHKRLFTVLSRTYAVNSIGRREVVLKAKNVTEDATDEFFDTYEGSSLFIADELVVMVDDLNAGNLTEDFFDNIAYQIGEVAHIFSKVEKMSSVTEVYEELARYLRDIDLQTIEPQNLKGFTYLAQILSDVSVYLMDMFVDRIFRDVYVFKDSLQNNIKFMEDTLAGVEEDEGEIDFF